MDHGDVKIMEEQLANAIESIVVSINKDRSFVQCSGFVYTSTKDFFVIFQNCPSCALGTNAIVWSTDV